MNAKGSIRQKLTRTVVLISIVSILLVGLAAVTGILGLSSQTADISQELGDSAAENSKTILEEEAIAQLEAIAESMAETVDARIKAITSQVDILAGAAQELYDDPGSYASIPVYPADPADQGTYTTQIVYAERTPPASVASEVGLLGNLGPAMRRTSEFLEGAGTTQIGTESGFIIMADENASLKVDMDYLDPVGRSWYVMAAESGELTWSDVFDDSFGRGLAVTCGKPVYNSSGDLMGVIAIGSQLGEISSTVSETTIGETGYAFVVDMNGDVIMSKDLGAASDGTVTTRRNILTDPELAMGEAQSAILSGESGVSRATLDGEDVFFAFEPMTNIPWTVITVITVSETLEASIAGEEAINALSDEAGEAIDNTLAFSAILLLIAVAVVAGLAMFFSSTFSRRLTNPILNLKAGVQEIADGNLDAQINLETGDELETLADAFNTMTSSLKTYIHDLTTVTAEKERIGAELTVATQIQSSMLPSIFPAFPERSEFDIYASMQPAKEVGGDFYDFFLVDEKHLGMVMADVSGKGVPAALFMVIAKTLIKNHAQNGQQTDVVLSLTNNQLCENNDASMFVTAWMGILNIETGHLRFSNAGHNPPLLRQPDGQYEYLQSDPGFVLAGLEDMDFSQESITMQPDAQLFLYTDGVTEAIDTAEELFGEERLQGVLNAHQSASPHELLDEVTQQLEQFTVSMEQFDDITMLSIRFHGTAQ